MRVFGNGFHGFGWSADFRKGLALFLLSAAVFVILILVDRPHWAEPWLIASVFTFALWRLGRQQTK